MKVHITLTRAVRLDPNAKDQAYRRLTKETTLSDVNVSRFHRHGIVTGEIAPHEVEHLRDFDFVESVSEERTKRISG
jgi:hypothetical protein